MSVLFAYITQAAVYLPFLRSHLHINAKDLITQLWPILPASIGGYLATSLLSASFGGTLVTLAVRALFTALVVALIHGVCTHFRCFQEAGKLILQNIPRGRLATETVAP